MFDHHWYFVDISDVSFHMAISLIFCLYNLIVTDSDDVSIEWERREMIERSIRSASNARRILRAYIDAESANSSFSILIKLYRRIKSINMMKRSISSARMILDQTSFLTDFLFFFLTSYLSFFLLNKINYLSFFLIDKHASSKLAICRQVIVADSLEVRRCSRLTRDTSL